MFAIAVRVPVITGSMIEVNVSVDKSTTAEEVNAVFKAQCRGQNERRIAICNGSFSFF